MKRCTNCGSTATREEEDSGKHICTICLHVVDENTQYTEEYKAINFKSQKKLDISKHKHKNPFIGQTFRQHIEGKLPYFDPNLTRN
jgi:transcription initiation factor TFIIIB Brf1 subunit/transcription initiation factor TFIIB